LIGQAATGVSVSDECIAEFNDIKLNRIKAKFVIYKIEDGKIVTEKRSESDNFEEFISSLPVDDCRYAIYDMNFTTSDGRPGNKIVMVAW
jgi:cofilin